MAFRTKWFLFLPALIGVAAGACGNEDKATSGSSNATWSTAQRKVAYRIDESFQNEKRSFELTLDFQSDGAVNLVELGTPASARMNGAGRLSYTPGENHPAAIYELIAISVLPPKGDELRVGHKWSYTRPDDAAAAASKGIVAQERFDYELSAIDAQKITLSVKGFLRIAPSAGLDSALAKTGMPAGTAALIGTYKPYVVGSAEFDRASGETLSASGLRVPFAFLGAGDPIQPGGTAIQYSFTRQ